MIIPPVGGSFRAGHRLDRILAGCPFAPLFEMKRDAMFSAWVAQIQRPMRVHRPGVRSAFPADDQQIDVGQIARQIQRAERSEAHTSELQSLMRISYAVFCLTTTLS